MRHAAVAHRATAVVLLAPLTRSGYATVIMFAVLLIACAADTPVVDSADVGSAVPALTSVTVACDDVSAEWTFAATADAWTGNGDVRLSADGAYVEAHYLPSVSAASDGSSDTLELALSIVADWRDVVSGARTAFNCDVPDLAGVLRIRTRDGSDIADCRAFGSAPERWSEWDPAVACGQVLEGAADSGG
jgi:hypothetical protein